ncbi:MAG TPA: lipocalin-like domain-containing protein [Bryobacteraceae bacterium]|nr:lipocalin-like domain-containing protein [Bryobacteraceae bacterium]
MLRILLAGIWMAPLVAAPGYRQAVPGYRFQFPRDHFNHPDFQTEWWYYTGNLWATDGHRWGFELVFFRQGAEPAARAEAGRNPSTWRVEDYYMAHLALTDVDGGKFRHFRRVSRAGPGMAGIDLSRGRIWNGNWESRWDFSKGEQTLSAVAGGVRFTFRAKPVKPPVIHGENGVSRKAREEGRASYYVSFPRLEITGTLNGAAVRGTAWMDHEWFTHLLANGERGWDWFSVQLDDGTELMLFQMRRDDGGEPFRAGTFVARDGKSTYLKPGDFTLEPLDWWKSAGTGARYPVKWRIAVPRLNAQLECAADVRDQELMDSAGGNTYWEGAVTYSGTARGVGYLEMTGYAGKMKM